MEAPKLPRKGWGSPESVSGDHMMPLGLLEAYGTVGLAEAAEAVPVPLAAKAMDEEATRLLAAGAAAVACERRTAQRTDARNLLIFHRGRNLGCR